MSKSKPTREAAKAIVSPFFAWSNAMLKGGELVLDSMAAAARNARTIRVAVLDDAPPRKSRKAKARAGRATRRRRR